MNKHVLRLILGGLIMVSTTLPLQAKDLTIRIVGIDTKRPGDIMVMLYGKDGYPKDHGKAVATQNKKASAKELDFKFKVSLNEFAVKVLHDETMDGKVAKNWTGILPAEGLGFSNGARIRFGPPSFKRSKLDSSKVGNGITIKMVYP